MYTESRNAARDGFAPQRARLLFSIKPNVSHATDVKRFARGSATEQGMRRDIVRKGLIGFIPSGAQ